MNSDNQTECCKEADGKLGRRRFVRGVGVAVPAAMTVSARSVLAGTCTTVSAQASINLAASHNAITDVNQSCPLTLTPSGWAAQVAAAPAHIPVPGSDSKFLEIFGSGQGWTTSGLNNGIKVGAAVTSGTDDVKLFAAAYLNLVNNKVIKNNGGTYYDLPQLIAMWQGIIVPGTGVSWSTTMVKDYLKLTMNLP